ncbi:acyl-CoA thioesterase [Corynebacterium massiliense]|uniref:acyl-CoA thioesterase n=1 Tax=Corynebacterium massiliense TaxID=441501 RepID=UPI002352DA50|nr:acyl-CoA thioesterase domain-containing protein [Corynebacterium massiliense]
MATTHELFALTPLSAEETRSAEGKGEEKAVAAGASGGLAGFVLPAVDSQLERTFGGQVVGQALAAATATVDKSRLVLSLHGYFIGPGDSTKPLRADVEDLRDSGTFSSRRVVVTQDGRVVFVLTANFTADGQTGPEHADPMPAVADPQDLEPVNGPFTQGVLLSDWEEWDIRPLPEDSFSGARRGVWFRNQAAGGQVLDGTGVTGTPQYLQRQLLAYMSDMTLPYVALKPHSDNMNDGLTRQIASLDHGMWFYGDIDVGEWLLYMQHSPVAGGGSGLNIGSVYTRSGELVAVVTQHTMMRDRR